MDNNDIKQIIGKYIALPLNDDDFVGEEVEISPHGVFVHDNIDNEDINYFALEYLDDDENTLVICKIEKVYRRSKDFELVAS
jgi:hypothetical protein